MSIEVRSRSPLARDLQPVRADTNMSVLIGVRITCEKSLFPLVCFNNIKSERFIYILRGFVIKQLLQSPLFDTSLLSTISVKLGNDGLCFHDLTYQLRFFCYP